MVALTAAVDARDGVAPGGVGPEVDEGVVEEGLLEAVDGVAVGVGVVVVVAVLIVVGAVVAAVDVGNVALLVLHVAGGVEHHRRAQGVVHLARGRGTDTVGEVGDATDVAAQVVAAVDVLADVGVAVVAVVAVGVAPYVGLGVAEDVGIARAAERVEQAAVAQVDMGAADDGPLVAAAVDVLGLGHVGTVARGAARHALHRAAQVDVGAVALVGRVGIVERVGRLVPRALADGALLAAAEHLEHVALVQVDGGAAPYLGTGTVAAAEEAEGPAEGVLALGAKDDAGVAPRDVVVAVGVDLLFAGGGVELDVVEHFVAVDDGAVDIDDDVAVDMTALVAAAIDVAAGQAAVLVGGTAGAGGGRGGVEADGQAGLGADGVPLQIGVAVGVELIGGAVGLHGPPLGLDEQALQVELQLPAAGVGVANQTAKVVGVIGRAQHVGIVAAADELLEDDDAVAEVDGFAAVLQDAAHIAAAVEGADVGRVVDIGGGVAVGLAVEHDSGQHLHGAALHVLGEGGLVGQVHLAERHRLGAHGLAVLVVQLLLVLPEHTALGGVDHIDAVVAQEDVVCNDVRAYLQLDHRVGARGADGGTVAAQVDGAVDDGGLVLAAENADGHLLGIGTVQEEGVGRRGGHRRVVVEVAPQHIVLELGVVGIGIRAVAAAVEVALDAGIHADGIAAGDTAGDVVAAIDIGHRAAAHQHTGRQAQGELVGLDVRHDVHRVALVVEGQHVGLAAAAEEVLDLDVRRLANLEQDAVLRRHVALVAAAVEVVDFAAQQVPRGTDVHGGLVVAAEDAAEVVAQAPRGQVDAHVHQLLVVGLGQLGVEVGEVDVVGQRDVAVGRHRRVAVVDADIGGLLHGGVVAAGIDIAVGAAAKLLVGLVDLRQREALVRAFGRLVVVVAVAAAEQLADEDVLALHGRVGGLALRGGQHEGVVRGVDVVVRGVRQFGGHGGRRADGAADVVAAIDAADSDVAALVLAVDMDEGGTADVGLTGTAEDAALDIATAHSDGGLAAQVAGVTGTIDVATNGNLCLRQLSRQAEQNDGQDMSHSLNHLL